MLENAHFWSENAASRESVLTAAPDEVEEPLAAFDTQLTEAMAETGNLDFEERRAKAGVVSRQLTIR